MTEMAELKVLLDELGRELQQSKADLGEERKDSRDLRTQLEVCVCGCWGGVTGFITFHLPLTGGEVVSGAAGRPGGENQRGETQRTQRARHCEEG